jgi:ubiquinone/menaquinone biosynthesis C-methylase UbiE
VTSLKELAATWNRLGKTDPLWAVLTAPGKRDNNWDIDEFLATGRDEVDALLQKLDGLNIAPQRGRALDFGCGVGRLSLALARHFEEVTGVDIAPSMLDRARQLANGNAKCRFVLNQDDNLSVLPDRHFDFIYSSITLQHMEPRYAERYIREFVRVVNDAGVVCFQVTGSVPHQRVKELLPRIFLKTIRRLRRTKGEFEMWAMGHRRVLRVVRTSGGRVVDMERRNGYSPTCPSHHYVVKRV